MAGSLLGFAACPVIVLRFVIIFRFIVFGLIKITMSNASLSLCSLCEETPTHHRCMYLIGGSIATGRICGALVCALCSVELGNEEGIFRCEVHSGKSDGTESGFDDEKNTAIDDKRDVPPPFKKKGKVTSKNVKSSEYTAKDLLVLSQAYIRVSENAVVGVSQKQNKFWDDVAEAYKELKTQQEAYDNRQRKRQKFNAIYVRGTELKDDEEEVLIQPRTSSSLQQKWSKFVQPLVTKFHNLTQRYPLSSGEGK